MYDIDLDLIAEEIEFENYLKTEERAIDDVSCRVGNIREEINQLVTDAIQQYHTDLK